MKAAIKSKTVHIPKLFLYISKKVVLEKETGLNMKPQNLEQVKH